MIFKIPCSSGVYEIRSTDTEIKNVIYPFPSPQ